MPDIEHGPTDAESLAHKLRSLESQLTPNERRLLKRVLTAAALSGIVLGVGGVGGASGGPAEPAGAGTAATESLESIRAQFVDAFTPGEEWTSTAGADVGLVN